MSAHSYIYVTIFYFLKMMLTYHISHEKNFQLLSMFLGVLGLIRCAKLGKIQGGLQRRYQDLTKGRLLDGQKVGHFLITIHTSFKLIINQFVKIVFEVDKMCYN